MAIPAGSRTAGGLGVSAITGVNGDPGPVVLLDAGDIPSTGPSNVQDDLDAVAGLIVISSAARLEAHFPNAGGVHTIDKQTIWISQTGAPIDLTGTGRSIVVAPTGTMTALGTSKVVLLGDVAGPLVYGELSIRGLAIKNANAAGSDIFMESLAGRFVELRNVALLGQNAGTVSNVTGGTIIEVLLQPAAPAATGLVFDNVIGVTILEQSLAQAPGGSSYTAISFTAAAAVSVDVRIQSFGFIGVLATDNLLYVDTAATLPGGIIPTNIVGFEVFGCSIKGGSRLFDPAGLDQTDIRILAIQNTGGPASQFIGDLIADTTVTPAPVPISQTHSLANTWEVVPANNGPAAPPNDVILAETSANERHTLTITSRQVWSMRYDGPEDQRTDVLIWEASARRSGGTAAIVSAQLEYNDGGGWLPLDETRDTISAGLDTIPTKISGRTSVLNNNGYELRLVSRTSAPATTTLWDKVRISKGI